MQTQRLYKAHTGIGSKGSLRVHFTKSFKTSAFISLLF